MKYIYSIYAYYNYFVSLFVKINTINLKHIQHYKRIPSFHKVRVQMGMAVTKYFDGSLQMEV